MPADPTMAVARVERDTAPRPAPSSGVLQASPRARAILVALAVVAADVLLLVRLLPGITGKPLFEDEAVAGLVGVEGLGDLLHTVVWDRGGAPLHFLLAHLVFEVDTSATALRWLSVICALAAVPVTFDLGRRLGGTAAGLVAAVSCACSSLLVVYGTFGRMYALYALAGALAFDLYLRCLDDPRAATAIAAAFGAWLLPAVHPYGGIVLAVGAAGALVTWRGRNVRAALPAVLIVASSAVFLLGDARLASRFGAGRRGARPVATPHQAWDQLSQAITGFAGGRGLPAAALAVLGIAGAAIAIRTRPAFGIVAVAALLAPPLLAVAARVPALPAVQAQPRHLLYGLGVWCAFIGLGATRLAVRMPRGAERASIAGVCAVCLISPLAARDIRTAVPYWARSGTPAALAAPAGWIDARLERGDVVYPYSAVYLESLPRLAHTVALPRAEPRTIEARLGQARMPVPALFVAVPTVGSEVAASRLRAALPGASIELSQDWLIVRRPGPFADRRAVMRSLLETLERVRPTVTAAPDVQREVALYFSVSEAALEDALRG